MPVSSKVRKLSVGAFFALLFAVGLLLVRDYGVSWDEPNNHLNGLVNLKYIASLVLPAEQMQHFPAAATTPDIRNFPDAHHGPVFEISAILLSYVFTDHDSRSYFLLRHSLIFSVFTLGVWALCQLGTHRFRDWRWGLLGAGLLVLSPRFFAEAFYNGKDIVYMAFFTMAMLMLFRLLARPTLQRAVWHGVATALVVDIRVHGLQLLLFTALGLLLESRFNPTLLPLQRCGQLAAVYLATAAVGIVAGWPYLWAWSVPELLGVASHAVRYPWGFTNYYLGQHLPSVQLPWHYIPVWMLVTIPVPYSLAAACGMLGWLRTNWQQGFGLRLRTPTGRLDLLLALWLLAPLAVVMTLPVVVYEGWRHLYYIYPALLLWAVRGVRWLTALLNESARPRRVAAATALALAALETGHTAGRMAQMHPHGNVYFSFLPGPIAERLFERDYWCLAYRQGLEWILAHDTAQTVTVNAFWHYPLYNNSLILKPEQRARLRYTPDSTARYYLAGYRWHPQSYLDSLGPEVHTIRAGGVKVLSVFQRPVGRLLRTVHPPANSLPPARELPVLRSR